MSYTETWLLAGKNYRLANNEFYILGSVHRDSILIRSNKKQQYAVIYLLQIYSTCNVVALLRDMTCTRGCSYSFMYS